jgi:hypothetical protein
MSVECYETRDIMETVTRLLRSEPTKVPVQEPSEYKSTLERKEGPEDATKNRYAVAMHGTKMRDQTSRLLNVLAGG